MTPPPKVLMVAEKPSIASALSGGRMSTQRGSTNVHEFDGTFLVDFPPKYQDWAVTDPLDLSSAPILKSESNPKAHICRHLSQEARGCGHLVLWLDCDREGYGPCQTPTLGFCVQRYLQITAFKPEKFWVLHPYLLKGGYELQLEWDHNKLFDYDVAVMFQKLVMEDGTLEVTHISSKEESKSRPPGLNTVNMLKVELKNSKYCLFEFLIVKESTAYHDSFDFKSTLGAQLHNPTWGGYVRALLDSGFHKPKSVTDAGDCPPITPMRAASEDMLGNDAWRLYQYICQHFIGTVSPDCKHVRTKIELSSGGELFYCVGQNVTAKGFTSIMPWLAVSEKNIPQFTKGEKVNIMKVELYEGNTSPPDYLSESELISLMEKHGIGTDTSILVHISNICERNFVQVNAGRRLVRTALGITLIKGYQCIDPDLCLPDIRSFIEQQITLIAKGQADNSHVVQHVLQQTNKQKKKNIDNMDALFEAQFSPLADSGYMIPSSPACLYCGTCKDLYKEIVCPLDNFELLLFSLVGPEAKSFPLCPYCYNNPSFEGIETLFGAQKQGSSGKLGRGAECRVSSVHIPLANILLLPKEFVHAQSVAEP
ncbi:hypothetical protein MKX01_041004 [Papaver californicum]|nr:hypothetical protein MKX01_041004 [Papaver californicum]